MRRARGSAAALAGWAVLVALALGPGSARADVLQDLGATFQEVAQALAEAFPRVETRVAAVDGGAVRLEGPGVAALRPGLELTAYRKGEPFRHPVTNQLLGHSETAGATLTVTAVAADHAMAQVVPGPGARPPMVGDGARLTAGRIPVAVLPTVGVNTPLESREQTALLLVARFSALLEKTGRFLAVDPRRILDLPADARGVVTLPPAEVATRLGGPAVLTSRLTSEGGARVLETAWISGQSGATLWAARTRVVPASFPPRFAWEQTPELERRLDLPGPVRGLAVADVDGDGRAELVWGDERTILVSRWQDGSGLIPVAGGEQRVDGTVLSVDAADVNGTGRAQVVVVDYQHNGRDYLFAQVLELSDGRWRTLYKTRGRFLRIVRVGAEPWLLEQDAEEIEPFSGEIRRLIWQDGRYVDGPTLRVPRGTSLYGLALLRLTGAPEPEVVAMMDDDRLAVWTARGQRLWTSGERLGGSALVFPWVRLNEGLTRAGLDAVQGHVLGRVVPLAPTADGQDILVYANVVPVVAQAQTVLPRVAAQIVNQGRIHRFRWRGGGFTRLWQSAITPGYIADFAYGDLQGDGIPEVVVGVVRRTFDLEGLNPLGRSRSQILFYELP